MKLSDFPVELVCCIGSYCSVTDLTVLSMVNSSIHAALSSPGFWRRLVMSRFGFITMEGDPKADYLRLETRSRLALASDLAVAWLDGHYWKLEGEPSILILNNVCWFDVVASFEGVESGKWTPKILAQFRRPSHVDRLEVIISVDGMPRATGVFGSDVPTEWQDFDLPHVELSGDRFHSVSIHIFGHDQLWKSGLAIDCIQLVPFEDRSLEPHQPLEPHPPVIVMDQPSQETIPLVTRLFNWIGL